MGNGRDGEDAARQLLQERYGLQLKKIQESAESSPDFEVLVEGRRIAVLEAKTTEYTGLEVDLDAVEDRLREYEATDIDVLERSLRDNIGSRVGTKIYKAAKQLAAYSEPKIVVLANEDGCADRSDLREALLGYLVDTSDCSVYTTYQPSVQERLRVDRTKIDLYLWIDCFGDPEVKAMRWTTDVGHRLCDEHFKAATVERVS